jgi:gamma-glutamylcyclotransferase (GGCT)/AIG2-like uncharacterized protein YtfP
MTAAKITQVFVYGTLKPGGRYHRAYCGGFAFEIEKAATYGQLFDFPELGYPGAIENSDHSIQGCLISFKHFPDEVLPKLDKLEGFDPNRPAGQNEYYRKQVQVFSPQGHILTNEAWCYFMTHPTISRLKGIPVPDGNWTGNPH